MHHTFCCELMSHDEPPFMCMARLPSRWQNCVGEKRLERDFSWHTWLDITLLRIILHYYTLLYIIDLLMLLDLCCHYQVISCGANHAAFFAFSLRSCTAFQAAKKVMSTPKWWTGLITVIIIVWLDSHEMYSTYCIYILYICRYR
jgi:hypothetical protein